METPPIKKPCYFYKQPRGCRFGANCWYTHEVIPSVISQQCDSSPQTFSSSSSSFTSTSLSATTNPLNETRNPSPQPVQYTQDNLVLPQTLPVLAITQPMNVYKQINKVEVRVLLGDDKFSVNVSRLSTIQLLKEKVVKIPVVKERWPADCKESSENQLVSKFVLIDEKHVKAPSHKVSKLISAKHYTTHVFYLPKGNDIFLKKYKKYKRI